MPDPGADAFDDFRHQIDVRRPPADIKTIECVATTRRLPVVSIGSVRRLAYRRSI